MRVSRRRLRDFGLLVVGAAIVIAGLWYVIPSRQKRVSLRITGGTAIGPRHVMALELKQKCEPFGIELEVVPTEGSDIALRSLEQGKLELAFVQGGLVGSQYRLVRQVAPLHIEPLHLLVNERLFADIQRSGLTALEGRRINTGVLGSGTNALALRLLNFLGLIPVEALPQSENHVPLSREAYIPSHLSYDRLLELKSEELPDAIFSIAGLPSSFAKELIEREHYKLVELPFADAFALDGAKGLQIQAADAGQAAGAAQGLANFDQSQVLPATIPAFTYSVRQQQPPKALPTIGTRVLLVASSSVDAATIERLLTILFDSAIAKKARPPLDVSIMETAPEFTWHQGSLNFIAHHRPLVAGSFIELAANGLAIAGSMIGGAFFVMQWYRRSRQHRSELKFRDYLNSVLEIEKRLVSMDSEGAIPVGELVTLHLRLVELKGEVASRFFGGELDDQTLMLGFMNLSNDVQNQIARLMLHERDNVEEIASKEHKNLQSLWSERLQEDPST